MEDPRVSEEDLAFLRDSVGKVLDAECTSREVHAFVDGEAGLEEKIWRHAAELGWLAVGVPEADGGLGYGARGLDILHREFGKHLAPGPLLATLSAAQWLSEHGDGAQKEAWIPRLASGEIRAAIPAALWPGKSATSDAPLVMLGDAGADLFILPADGAFALVDRNQAAPSPILLWDGTRNLCSVRASAGSGARDVIPDSDGSAGTSLATLMALAIAGDSLGLAQQIFDQTVDYMKTRVQFDKVIGSFQALKHRAADLATMLVTQEHLLAQALDAAQDGSSDADMWAMLAKAGATEAASHVAADCLQLHGGVGFTSEYDVHLFLKRARLNEMLVGTNGTLRDRAAQALLAATGEPRSTMELSS